MRYILHYTDPGDIIFDGFCGTGMTGVAATLCEDPDLVRQLTGEIELRPKSSGIRYSVLSDLSPVATFISRNYNVKQLVKEFENGFE